MIGKQSFTNEGYVKFGKKQESFQDKTKLNKVTKDLKDFISEGTYPEELFSTQATTRCGKPSANPTNVYNM